MSCQTPAVLFSNRSSVLRPGTALLSLLILSLASLAGATWAQPDRSELSVDRFGQPVIDADGNHLRYDRFETEAAMAQARLGAETGAGKARTQTVLEDLSTLDSLAGAAKSTIPGLRGEESWHHVQFGVGIGDKGLYLARFDGTGNPSHIVATAGEENFDPNSYWYVLKEGAAGFEFTWQSDFDHHDIDDLTVADVDGDGIDEVLVAMGGRVEIWGFVAGAMERISGFFADVDTFAGLTVADVDGDGSNEVLFCDDDTELVVTDLTGYTEFRSSLYGCSDLAVGQVDDDAGLEIVATAGASGGWVLDGATRALEWDRAGGFGDDLVVADVDGDGRDEILAAFRWNDLFAFSGETQSLAWVEDVDLDLDSLTTGDWNGDGIPEVIYGDGQWGDLHVLSGLDGSLIESIDNPGHGVAGLTAGTLGSGVGTQLLWSHGYSSTAADHLLLYDSTSATVELESPSHFGPHYSLAHGMLGGQRELIYSTYYPGGFDGDPSYFQVNADTLEPIQASAGIAGGPQYLFGIEAADLDGDGDYEVLAGGDDGVLAAYEGSGQALRWQSAASNGHQIHGIEVVDVDGDGDLEVVASAHRRTTAAAGPAIFVFDAADGSTEWQSPALINGFAQVPHLRVANVDADPALEILVAAQNDDLWVFDGQTGTQELVTSSLKITALDTADRDGDGVDEIFVGNDDGEIVILDPTSGLVSETVYPQSYDPIQGLQVVDLNEDGDLDYAFALRGRPQVVSGADGSVLWADSQTSPVFSYYDNPEGEMDSLLVGNLDSDPAMELWLNLGTHGMKIYKLTPVSHTAPTFSLVSHTDGQSVEGPEITLTGAAFDAEDGDISSTIVWTSHTKSRILGRGSSVTARLGVGSQTLSAIVYDSSGYGAYQVFNLTLTPGNAAPSILITEPVDGAVFEPGPIQLTGQATDPEDGDLSSQITWNSDLDGDLGSGAPSASLSVGEHLLVAEVTDSGGKTAEQIISVTVAPQGVAGLMGYWALDDGAENPASTIALDGSAMGRDGILEPATPGAGPRWIEGRLGGAIELDGTDDLVRVAADFQLDELSAFTVVGWIRHGATNAFHSIVDKRDQHTDGFDLYLNSSSRLFVRINNAALNGTAVVADGSWHHVAGTYDGSELRLYVDGVLDASLNSSAGVSSTTTDLLIGRNWSGGFLFEGALDDLRLYGRALEPAEIQAVYEAPAPQRLNPGPSGILPAGTTEATLQVDTDEPASCAFDTVAGTDFSSMAYAFGTSDDLNHSAVVTGLQDATTYVFYVRCSDLTGNANDDDLAITFEVADPNDTTVGLIGRWPLDGDGDDASPFGHHGVFENGGLFVPGISGSAVEFDGFETGIRVASTPTLASPSEISISAWIQVQPQDAGSFMSIVDKRDGNLDGYDLFLTGDAKLFMRINDQSHTGLTVLADGAWHHVMGVYDGSTLALWVDGVLETTKTVGAETLDTTATLRIGEHWSFGPYYFHGLIDEVRVYERALGPADAALLSVPPAP